MKEHRMIDVEDLKDAIEYDFEDDVCCTKELFRCIDCQPTVDAVEVVRCKDCIHWDDGSCPMGENYPWCDTKSDDFCSYGEKEE